MSKLKKITTKRGVTRFKVRVFVGRDGAGKPIQLAQTFDTAREAKDWAASVRIEWGKGKGVARSVFMRELQEDLLRKFSLARKSAWAPTIIRAHLGPFFGGLRSDQVTTAVIERYVEQRKAQGRKDGTIRRELTLLRRVFRLGQECTPPKVATIPHFPKLQDSPARKGFFELAEYEAMFARLPSEVRIVLAFAFYTGCRRGEILTLKWEQVDFAEGLFRLEPGTTKNKEARVIPMTPELTSLLSAQKAFRDAHYPNCPWVFFRHASGTRLKEFRTAWEKACKACGLWDEELKRPTRLLHDLRRSGVRNLVRSGVPERVAMAISGHKTRSVFDRYNIVSENDIKAAAVSIQAYIQRARQQQAAPVSTTVVQESPETESPVPAGESQRIDSSPLVATNAQASAAAPAS